jgi:filamentous hemagglutinin
LVRAGGTVVARVVARGPKGKILSLTDDVARAGTATNRGFHSNGYRSEFYDAAGNPTKWRDPVSGKLEDIPAGAKFHKDHVFPKKEIEGLPRFDELTPAQQRTILNDPKNFQPLRAPENCSKGCRIVDSANDWTHFRGEPINPQYRQWLGNQQQQMRNHLTDRINDMLGG